MSLSCAIRTPSRSFGSPGTRISTSTACRSRRPTRMPNPVTAAGAAAATARAVSTNCRRPGSNRGVIRRPSAQISVVPQEQIPHAIAAPRAQKNHSPGGTYRQAQGNSKNIPAAPNNALAPNSQTSCGIRSRVQRHTSQWQSRISTIAKYSGRLVLPSLSLHFTPPFSPRIDTIWKL